MDRLKTIVKPILCPIRDFFRYYPKDIRARKSLKAITTIKHESSKTMKVGFIVFEPETWDKQEKIYNELVKRDNVQVDIIVVPSFDRELRLVTEYGKEREFFRAIDSNCIMACNDDGQWINLEHAGYDYIFYQDPYNIHMPNILRSDNTVRFTKICYIPYGYVGSNVFYRNNTNRDFFRNVYCEFVDIEEIQTLLNEMFKHNVKNGYQRFIRLGYPALMDSYVPNCKKNDTPKNIMWTPRWSYHPITGGSNFLAYKEEFHLLAEKYPQCKLCIRPHPMMFQNFIKEGLMSNEEKEDYLQLLHNKQIICSEGMDLKTDFMDTEILITDFSSIIPQFFMSGKPIIYCNSNIPLNKEYSKMAEGMYISNSWDEVVNYLDSLLNGNDFLFHTRQCIIQEMVVENQYSEKRIVDYLIADYRNSGISI